MYDIDESPLHVKEEEVEPVKKEESSLEVEPVQKKNRPLKQLLLRIK